VKIKARGGGVHWPSRFVRFLIVGGFNTAFGFAVFTVVYAIANSHHIAIVICTCWNCVQEVWYLAIGRPARRCHSCSATEWFLF
jgi:hypothetical protein